MSDAYRAGNIVPWFMYDIFNQQLITTKTIPGDIVDTKDILYTEVPIPGRNFAPVNIGGNGNRKIAFTLPLMQRDDVLGNSVLLKQFAQLRNQFAPIGQQAQQFNSNPKVLYYWGIGSVPLIYFVKTISFSHKARWVNAAGNPQYSEASIELWLDESDPIYSAEESFRRVSGILSQADLSGGSFRRRVF